MPEFKPIKISLKAAALNGVRNNDLEMAIEQYKEYLALEPNQMDDDAWAGLGGAYRRKRDFESALSSYKRAFQINPQSTYSIGNIISLLAARYLSEDRMQLQQYLPEAIRLTERKASAPESDHWAWYDLATTQLIEGLFDESKSEEAAKTFYFAAERTPPSAKEYFRSVLSHLTFLVENNPKIPRVKEVIEMIKKRTE